MIPAFVGGASRRASAPIRRTRRQVCSCSRTSRRRLPGERRSAMSGTQKCGFAPQNPSHIPSGAGSRLFLRRRPAVVPRQKRAPIFIHRQVRSGSFHKTDGKSEDVAADSFAGRKSQPSFSPSSSHRSYSSLLLPNNVQRACVWQSRAKRFSITINQQHLLFFFFCLGSKNNRCEEGIV